MALKRKKAASSAESAARQLELERNRRSEKLKKRDLMLKMRAAQRRTDNERGQVHAIMYIVQKRRLETVGKWMYVVPIYYIIYRKMGNFRSPNSKIKLGAILD